MGGGVSVKVLVQLGNVTARVGVAVKGGQAGFGARWIQRTAAGAALGGVVRVEDRLSGARPV